MIVAHELFGVNPDVRRVADDLAAAGYIPMSQPTPTLDLTPASAGGPRRPAGAGRP